MKHNIVYFIVFCLSVTQIIHPALSDSNRDGKHTALKESISRARRASIADPLAASMSRGNDTPGIITLVAPLRSNKVTTQPEQADAQSDDDHNLSATSRISGSAAHRRHSDPFSDGLSISMLSESSLQAAAQQEDQALTPQQRMRNALTKAKLRRAIQTPTATPSGSPSRPSEGAITPTNISSGSGIALPATPPNNNRELVIAPTGSAAREHGASNDDEIIELHRTSDAAVETDPINPHLWRYVLTGSTSALTSSLATWRVMSWLYPQRISRMFTGFEVPAAMFAGQTTGKIVAATAGVVAVTYAGTKFNGWLHAGCHSKQELLEMKFEAALRDRMMEHRKETVKQITDVAAQLDKKVDDLRADTDHVVGHLVEAVDHAADLLAPQPTASGHAAPAGNPRAAATLLHAAAGQASDDIAAQASRATHIVPPPAPQEKATCGCCCVQ